MRLGLNAKCMGTVIATALWTLTPLQAQELKTINFMSVNEKSCLPYPQFSIQEFGFLAEEGLQVNLLSTSTSVPYVAFLANGDADIALFDPGEVFQAVDSGQPIKVIYEAFQSGPESIAVPADGEVKSLVDLRGKTVGLARHRDQTTMIIALGTVGIDISEITTVVVGDMVPTIVKALEEGAIQAFSGSVAERAAIEAAGIELRNITPAAVTQIPGNSFVVWGPTLEEKRPMIEGFLRAWAKAQHAGTMDTQAVMSVCKKRVPEQWEQEARGRYMVEFGAYTALLRRTVKFGEPQPDVWQRVQIPYIELDEISGELDVSTFLDTSFIEAANSFTTDDVKRGVNAWREANAEIIVP